MNKFGSLNIKIALVLTGVFIGLLILFYSQLMVNKIQKRETQIAQLYAKSLEYIAQDESASGEYSFIFDQIISQINFPIVATDKDYTKVDFYKNVDIDTTLPQKVLNDILLREANSLREINTPIKVAYNDSIIFNYVNYGQSSLITELKFLPYFEIIVGGIFIILGYIGFSYIKKNEQSNIWVGLSRETAHQLGTPLSSLMGWLEVLKTIEPRSETLDEVTVEISNDIEKLNKIAGRFSKIGSMPKLTNERIKKVIQNVCDYFEKRIPKLTVSKEKQTKKISVSVDGSDELCARINKDLFEWVIENFLKNSLDAIHKSVGVIQFSIQEKEKEVWIDIYDNGKGIDKKYKSDIFRPGFSTKTRGWGLGLTLAKRIIEDYHRGKLILVESVIDHGTTFRIKLQR